MAKVVEGGAFWKLLGLWKLERKAEISHWSLQSQERL